MSARKIGAFWLKKDKNGQSYMAGSLEDLSGDIKVVLFKNSKKEKENQPDYLLYLSEPKEDKQIPIENSGLVDVSNIPF